MRRLGLLALLLSLLGGGRALAREATFTEEEQLRQAELLLRLGPDVRRWTWSVFAQAAARPEALEAAAGVEVTLEGSDCRWLRAGGLARAVAEPELQRSFEQWLSVCLFRVPVLESWTLGHHLEWGVRPSLAAPRSVWRRPFVRETIDVTAGMLDLRPSQGSRLLLFHVEASMWFLAQADGAETRQRTGMDVEVPLVRWVGPRSSVDVLMFRPHGITGELSQDVMELVPLRLEGVRLGPEWLRADLEGAWAMGSFSRPLTAEQAQTGEVNPALLQVSTVTGNVAVRVETPRLSASLGAARSMAGTFDDELAIEDRLSAAVVGRHRRLELGVRGFAARTDTWRVDARHALDHTGGAAVTLDRDLGRALHLGVTAEAARSFYARLDGDARPVVGTGVRTLAVISGRWGTGSP